MTCARGILTSIKRPFGEVKTKEYNSVATIASSKHDLQTIPDKFNHAQLGDLDI
jgi:hypothetical protein